MAIDPLLFYAINGIANRSEELDIVAVFGAVILLPLMLFLLIPAAFTIKRFKEEHWYELPIKILCAGAIGYGLRILISMAVNRPRPFAALSDARLLIAMDHTHDSFPSGHTSIAFALGFALYRHDKDWGIAFLLLAAVVAVSRIVVGVHYPADIAGGVVVGWIAAWAAYKLEHAHLLKHARTLRAR